MRWVKPIAEKRVKLVNVEKVCPHSKRSLERWLSAYKRDGEDTLEPKATIPKTSPNETPIWIKERVITKRKKTKLCALKLHWRITTDDYDKKCQELKTRQYNINDQIKKHLKADETFKITVNTVFSIASIAYELFESSKIEQKRKLINYVFSNLELDGVTLRYSLRKPFDLMVDCSTRSEWLGHKDSNLDLRIQRPTYCHYTMPQ